MTAVATHRPILVMTDEDIRRNPDRWLTERGTGIGASEIAAVLGISPWDSAFSVYWRKRLATTVEMDEAMEWGLRHERAIAEKFAENHPDLHLAPGGLYRHPATRWMLATPDRLAYDHPCPGDYVCNGCTPELVQIKTTHSWDEWGEPGTNQIPAHYAAQVQQEMTVMGAEKCWVPVLCAGNSYREYLVEYNPADADTIRQAGGDFMHRLITGDAPDVDGSAATTRTLKQLHPSVVDEVVTIPLPLADQYTVRRALLKDAEAAYAEVSNQILALLGDARTAAADGRRIASRSVYEQRRIDSKRLKADHPDLWDQYATTATIAKLTPTKESK